MNATVLMLTLILARLIVPFGLLLLIGEWVQRRQRAPYQ